MASKREKKHVETENSFKDVHETISANESFGMFFFLGGGGGWIYGLTIRMKSNLSSNSETYLEPSPHLPFLLVTE